MRERVESETHYYTATGDSPCPTPRTCMLMTNQDVAAIFAVHLKPIAGRLQTLFADQVCKGAFARLERSRYSSKISLESTCDMDTLEDLSDIVLR